MPLRYPTRKSSFMKKILRFPFFFQSIFVEKRGVIRRDRDYQMDWEACTNISFYFFIFDSGTSFPSQYRSPSSHFTFYYCSRWINYQKQSSHEIKFFRGWDCSQDKNVWYTGTTEPRTQPNRKKGNRFCKWLFCWLWATGSI